MCSWTHKVHTRYTQGIHKVYSRWNFNSTPILSNEQVFFNRISGFDRQRWKVYQSRIFSRESISKASFFSSYPWRTDRFTGFLFGLKLKSGVERPWWVGGFEQIDLKVDFWSKLFSLILNYLDKLDMEGLFSECIWFIQWKICRCLYMCFICQTFWKVWIVPKIFCEVQDKKHFSYEFACN